jgi:hypothetical protein
MEFIVCYFSPLKRGMKKRSLSSFITEFSESDLAMENRGRVVVGFVADSELSNLCCCFKNETEGMYEFMGHGEGGSTE